MSKPSVLARLGEKYGVDADKLYATLAATAFKQRDGSAPSVEQMMALSVVADQYKLNPFTREIYAFPDRQNGIVPVVGVDGWLRIINSHPEFDGMEFNYSESMVAPQGANSECYEWIECIIYRKDRERPIAVREFLDEVYRAPFKQGMVGPWQTHPKRFLRHKAIIQAARVAFGFGGIYDNDEAERIVEQQERDMGNVEVVRAEAPQAPKQLEHYPQDDFDTNYPKWAALIESGKRTPEQIVQIVSQKAPLTDEQKQSILELAPAPETVEQDAWEADYEAASQEQKQ